MAQAILAQVSGNSFMLRHICVACGLFQKAIAPCIVTFAGFVMVYTQFVVVERCRSCGVCGYEPDGFRPDYEARPVPTVDLVVKRLAEEMKQLQGELATIAKELVQVSQARADESVNIAGSDGSDGGTTVGSKTRNAELPLDDVEHRCYGIEDSADATVTTNLRFDDARQCSDGNDGSCGEVQTRLDNTDKPTDDVKHCCVAYEASVAEVDEVPKVSFTIDDAPTCDAAITVDDDTCGLQNGDGGRAVVVDTKTKPKKSKKQRAKEKHTLVVEDDEIALETALARAGHERKRQQIQAESDAQLLSATIAASSATCPENHPLVVVKPEEVTPFDCEFCVHSPRPFEVMAWCNICALGVCKKHVESKWSGVGTTDEKKEELDVAHD